jgi:hypothetical protein
MISSSNCAGHDKAAHRCDVGATVAPQDEARQDFEHAPCSWLLFIDESALGSIALPRETTTTGLSTPDTARDEPLLSTAALQEASASGVSN